MAAESWPDSRYSPEQKIQRTPGDEAVKLITASLRRRCFVSFVDTNFGTT